MIVSPVGAAALLRAGQLAPKSKPQGSGHPDADSYSGANLFPLTPIVAYGLASARPDHQSLAQKPITFFIDAPSKKAPAGLPGPLHQRSLARQFRR
jgi:hypothetical protein